MNNCDATKLAPDEFRKALRQGRGAAMMHVLSQGLDGVAAFVLEACVQEQAFDAQCEGHRASWLYRMFKDAPEYALFRERIIAELRDMSTESSAEQICELAALMAGDGDTDVGAALRSFVWAQDFETASGCRAITSIDGFPALLEIARRYGRILQGDPTAFIDSLDQLTNSADACKAAFTELSIHAKADPAIAAYLEREQQEIDRRLASDRESPEERSARRERIRAEVRAQFPLDQVIAAAMRHDRAKGKFVRFGKWCGVEALNHVLERLTIEEDLETCLRLLWVFRYAAPSYIPERLWVFAIHTDSRIRDAALTALAHSDDPAVGEFGRKYLAQNTFSAEDAAAIELFSKHYKSGDEDLIMGVLNRLHPDEEEAHRIGMSIRAFAKENHSLPTLEILNWLYRTNPCTICRADAIRLLIRTGPLFPVIAMECRYDASDEIRDLVK